MSKRKAGQSDRPPPTRLKVPRQQAAEKLAERAELGKQLLQRQVSPGGVREVEHEVTKWADYNQTLIRTLFEGDELPFEYSTARPVFISSPYDSEFVRARHLTFVYRTAGQGAGVDHRALASVRGAAATRCSSTEGADGRWAAGLCRSRQR